MRHYSAENLYNSAGSGNLGTAKTSLGADVLKSITHGAFDMFRQIKAAALGQKKEDVHRAK